MKNKIWEEWIKKLFTADIDANNIECITNEQWSNPATINNDLKIIRNNSK